MTERAICAGGCFWGMQDLIRKLDGVVSTRVGYTGGDVANATFRVGAVVAACPTAPRSTTSTRIKGLRH